MLFLDFLLTNSSKKKNIDKYKFEFKKNFYKILIDFKKSKFFLKTKKS